MLFPKGLVNILVFVVLIGAAACSRNATLSEPSPATSVAASPDTQSVRLKDIIVERLPQPYYHYQYDEKGLVTHIDHASGEARYTALYDNKGRIKKLFNLIIFNGAVINNDTLIYEYTDDKVTTINMVNMRNVKFKEVLLSYDFSGRLKEIWWWNINAGKRENDRKVIFSYRPDGNIASYEDYFAPNGVFQLTATHYFHEYDNKVNVERNRFFKNYGEHFLYLPQVSLQKNNCLKQGFKAGPNELEIVNTFTYTNDLPSVKTTAFRVLSGSGAGLPVPSSNTAYTYY
ncbi:MAG TPA: hypothetical protein VD996_03220 [Chitinophagaceae bacterium]|nr:hypothetical protein [Chitinophagaceae bacterium]